MRPQRNDHPQIPQITQMNYEDEEQRDPRTYAIIGASMEVHNTLGCGFLEPVYHQGLMIEFPRRQVPFVHEAEIPIYYKGIQLETVYRCDFLCYESIIVEVKALSLITGTEEAQLIHYLKATGAEIGLIINFGASSLQYRRFVNTSRRRRPEVP